MALVLWSGGCDSTLVLHDLGRKSSADKPVRALSIRHFQVGAQAEQRKARLVLLKEMRRRGFYIKCAEVTVTKKGAFHILSSGVSQPMLWLLHGIPFLRQDEDLHMGIVYGDNSILQHIEDLQRTFDACQRMRECGGELKLPFRHNTKGHVIGRLKELKLYKHCWWCEAPQKGLIPKPCGKCGPCTTHATALYQAKMWPKKYGYAPRSSK